MSNENLEDKLREALQRNNELIREVQHWKLAYAQLEKEKLEVVKDANELRLKLSNLRNTTLIRAQKFDAEWQSTTEKVLPHLVHASDVLAKALQLTKQYTQDCHKLDSLSPQWSQPSVSKNSDKVNRVKPLLLGGQSIQPVVALSRTMLNNRTMTRNPNQNSGVTHRALPIHMLQDVYIPLIRIDAQDQQADESGGEDDNLQNGSEHNMDSSLEDSNPQNDMDLEESNRLDAVMEEIETEDDVNTPTRVSVDNPLEGPSWLLDVSKGQRSCGDGSGSTAVEADSTTPMDRDIQTAADESVRTRVAPLCFTPTVRRRAPPRVTLSPRELTNSPPVNSNDRVLKVVVSKMRMSEDELGAGDPPPKRAAVETPSPVEARSPQTKGEQSPHQDRTRSPRTLGTRSPHPERSRSPRNLGTRSPQPGRSRSPRNMGTRSPHPGRSRTPRNLGTRSPQPRGSRSPHPLRSRSPLPRGGRDEGSPSHVTRRSRKRDHHHHSQFDAPSPNGATDARVIVLESDKTEESDIRGSCADLADNGTRVSDNGTRVSDNGTRVSDNGTRVSDNGTRVSDNGTRVPDNGTRVSDNDTRVSENRSRASVRRCPSEESVASDDGRTRRRARRNVSYKEKPLNRKLRR